MSSKYIPSSLRKVVISTAKSRCEYCLIPEETSFTSHEIDHIITEKYGGQTNADHSKYMTMTKIPLMQI